MTGYEDEFENTKPCVVCGWRAVRAFGAAMCDECFEWYSHAPWWKQFFGIGKPT